MKVFFRTLTGENFEMEVKPKDTVTYVKETIESRNGADKYPAGRQVFVHKGRVLKDGTTMEENDVAENSSIIIVLSKNDGSQVDGSTISSGPTLKAPQTSVAPPSTPVTTTPQPPAAAAAPAPTSTPAANDALDVYRQAASTRVAFKDLEGTVQQILDMGGGTWDRDTVVRALQAAYDNPERAVEYLYSIPLVKMVSLASLLVFNISQGIPDPAEGPSTSASVRGEQTTNNVLSQLQQAAQPAPVPSTGPNANPLDLFPQHFPSLGSNAGGADTEIFHTISNMTGQLEGAFTQALIFTHEERDAIDRLEAMGFRRTTVIQAFLACNRNEELAANYLLDHMHELDD